MTELQAAIAALEKIRDSTYRNEADLRGIAYMCLNRIRAGDYSPEDEDGEDASSDS